MFKFYPTIPPEPILDSTYNAGRMWKGSKRKVVSMDIDPRYKPMIVGDNRVMNGVKAATYGAVIFDPPHVGPQGRDKSKKRFDVDFGATIMRGRPGLEPELSLSAVLKTGHARIKAERLAARQNHRHGEQPKIEMAAR